MKNRKDFSDSYLDLDSEANPCWFYDIKLLFCILLTLGNKKTFFEFCHILAASVALETDIRSQCEFGIAFLVFKELYPFINWCYVFHQISFSVNFPS